MSGGAFNYLCLRFEGSDLAGDIGSMADRLERTGYPDAATATRQVLELAASLKEVWRAAEWADSNDGDEDDVTEAVAAWRDAGKPPAIEWGVRFAALGFVGAEVPFQDEAGAREAIGRLRESKPEHDPVLVWRTAGRAPGEWHAAGQAQEAMA